LENALKKARRENSPLLTNKSPSNMLDTLKSQNKLDLQDKEIKKMNK